MKLFSLQHIFTYGQFFVFHVLFVIVIAAYKNLATVMSTYPMNEFAAILTDYTLGDDINSVCNQCGGHIRPPLGLWGVIGSGVVGCLSPAVSYQVELDFTCCASFNAQC